MMTQNLLILMVILCFPSSCFGFSASEDESGCKAWKYGIDCQYNCSSSCNFDKCSISHHKGVPVCNDGCKKYHTGIFCQEFCPSLCLECNQTDGTCNKCINGYYGETCNKTCNRNCLNGTCDVDGHCIIAPHTGVNNKPNSLNSEGPCLKKNENGTGCLCCKTTLRGDECKTVCQNCQTYYIPNDTCEYQCQAGYYGTTCTYECPQLCKHGNSGKPICEITGDGLTCMNGCHFGHTGLQCNDTCKGNCSSNTCYQMDGRCIHCPNGKYGDMCFETCSSGCHNRTCNRDGTCKVGCQTGLFGKTCNYTCPEACFSCKGENFTDVNCVFDCKPGYHGSLCKNKCSEGCKDNICDKVDGRCVRRCKPSYYDLRCEKNCSEGCKDSICSSKDGSCLNGCKNGFYRGNCTGICGDFCTSNTCEEHFDRNNPTVPFLCSLGCEDGHKGRSCNEECPKHCLVCKQLSDDGCVKCDHGYNPENGVDEHSSCIKTVPELALSHVIIIIVCTTVFVIIITLIIYKLLKRRRPSSSCLSLPCIGAGKSRPENRRQVNEAEQVALMENRGIAVQESNMDDRGNTEQESNMENSGIAEQESNVENKECNDQGNKSMIQACRTGKLGAVKSIHRHNKKSINVSGRHGMTPIMEATGKGHTEVADFLLQNDCDLSAVAENMNTVLHVACDRGNIGFVKDLLNTQKFDINAKGNMGRSPLMIASRIGNKDLFDLLMREGADVNTRDCSNDTVLHVACFNRNEAFLTYLLNQEVMKRFINLTGCKGRTPVMLAAYNGYKEMFDLLWNDPDRNESAKDDKDNNNDTILHVACYNDNAEFVGHLLSLKGFDIECKGCKGRTPAMIAAQNGCRKVLELLVKKGCDLAVTDEKSHNILTLACCTDNVAFVEYLLTLNKFDINTKGNKGRTPLLVAARNSCSNVFELLVKEGGNLSAIDDNGDCIQSLARGNFEKNLTTMNLFDEIIKA